MKTALLFSALLLAGASQAQTVWRCGPDGRSYSGTPCAEGRVVAVADPRSAAEVAAGREVAARESALARNLALQRSDRERETLAAQRTVTLRTANPPTNEKIRPVALAQKPAKRQRQQQDPHQKTQLTPSRTATGGTLSTVAPASQRKTG